MRNMNGRLRSLGSFVVTIQSDIVVMEEIGDKYTCTYGCPVNQDGQGICSKVMTVMFPIMEAVRSGGDLKNIGGDSHYSKDIVCPDGCVMFRMTAKKLDNENFYKGKFFDCVQ